MCEGIYCKCKTGSKNRCNKNAENNGVIDVRMRKGYPDR